MAASLATVFPQVLGTSHSHRADVEEGSRQYRIQHSSPQGSTEQWQQKHLSSKLDAFLQSKRSAKP